MGKTWLKSVIRLRNGAHDQSMEYIHGLPGYFPSSSLVLLSIMLVVSIVDDEGRFNWTKR